MGSTLGGGVVRCGMVSDGTNNLDTLHELCAPAATVNYFAILANKDIEYCRSGKFRVQKLPREKFSFLEIIVGTTLYRINI